MSNATPLCFAKIGIFWMSNERGEGQPIYQIYWLHFAGFRMTSLKCKQQNYRSYLDFTFTMY